MKSILFFTLLSTSVFAKAVPCHPYLYIESYRIKSDSLPQGLVVADGKDSITTMTSGDYFYYGEDSPIMIVERNDYMKLEKGRLYKYPKGRFKNLRKDENPLNEPWPDRPNPELELRLNQLVHVKHPWPNGSAHKIEQTPEHDFRIDGLLNPRLENRQVTGTPFKIYGTLYFREVRRECPKTR